MHSNYLDSDLFHSLSLFEVITKSFLLLSQEWERETTITVAIFKREMTIERRIQKRSHEPMNYTKNKMMQRDEECQLSQSWMSKIQYCERFQGA